MDTNQEEVERVNTDVSLSTSIQADRQQNVGTTNKSSVSNPFLDTKINTDSRQLYNNWTSTGMDSKEVWLLFAKIPTVNQKSVLTTWK